MPSIDELAAKVRPHISSDVMHVGSTLDLDTAVDYYKGAINGITRTGCKMENIAAAMGGLAGGDERVNDVLHNTKSVSAELISDLVDLKFEARIEFLRKLQSTCTCDFKED